MPGNNKGFSLIELLVVIAIIGVIALVTAPNMVTGLPKYRVKSAAQAVTSKLRKARSLAVKKHSNLTVQFDVSNNTLNVDGVLFPDQDQGLTGYYGSGVCFGRGSSGAGDKVTFGGDKVTFNSRGLSNAGSVYLTNNRKDAYKVTVNSAGRIRMTHWTGGAWK